MASIVNVKNLGNVKLEVLIDRVNNIMSTVENKAFAIAVYGAYVTGTAIPCEKGKDGKTTYVFTASPIQQKDFAEKVDKNKATISRWIKAVKYIISCGLEVFNAFNNGEIRFTFDKIIALYQNEVLNEKSTVETIKEEMNKTLATIESDIAGSGRHNDKSSKTPKQDEKKVEEPKESGKIVEFTYNKKKYSVDESYLTAFISKYCKVK